MTVTLDPGYRVLRAATVLAAILTPVYFFVGSFGLEGELPMQYSGGEVSRSGSLKEARSSVAFLGVLAIGLTVLARFPHTFTYLVEITEENKQRQHRNAAQMVLWLAAIFTLIQFVMVGNWLHGLPIVLIWVPLAGGGTAIIYFIVQIFRLR